MRFKIPVSKRWHECYQLAFRLSTSNSNFRFPDINSKRLKILNLEDTKS